ncbi:hypothetical protein DFP92_101950 [Yoonia sediminilitoris]|uniref:Uncharacterized protein n=1 Tax=Yoonia sediminilitoris TaxID=1286148 RepID=A0A2T6KS24_9RHOB|nr:hypothetical protein C8N45_101950 [Yoonia sediminilitoris]RCW99520.1 hypothetical protein DFP92_101950 [Yoonia sediminilitoris]
MSDEAVATWLDNRGYGQALPIKYGQWLGVFPWYEIAGTDGETRRRCPEGSNYCGILQDDWGDSTVFKDEVRSIIGTVWG